MKELEDLKSNKAVGVAAGKSNEEVLKEWLEQITIQTRQVIV